MPSIQGDTLFHAKNVLSCPLSRRVLSFMGIHVFYLSCDTLCCSYSTSCGLRALRFVAHTICSTNVLVSIPSLVDTLMVGRAAFRAIIRSFIFVLGQRPSCTCPHFSCFFLSYPQIVHMQLMTFVVFVLLFVHSHRCTLLKRASKWLKSLKCWESWTQTRTGQQAE